MILKKFLILFIINFSYYSNFFMIKSIFFILFLFINISKPAFNQRDKHSQILNKVDLLFSLSI